MSFYTTLAGGATLYYTDEGGGEPLLFVHGWTCDSTDFLYQLAYFRANHRVIAADLRGHGRPSVPKDGYDVRTLARDLVELLDYLEIRDCVAIGHSLGGLIVSVLAVEYAERIRGLVCLDPAYGVSGGGVEVCRELIAQMREPEGPHLLAQAFARWERASTPSYFRELHVRRMLAMERTVVTETFRQLFTGSDPLACRERSEHYLVRRRCPVLSIHALDASDQVEWEARLSRHPASRFLHLPLGHWLQQDAPDLVNQLIEHWLGAIVHHESRAELQELSSNVICAGKLPDSRTIRSHFSKWRAPL